MGDTDNGVATVYTIATRRLKREDCSRTKHDSAFSHWKILIGTSDWEDHAQGKEGAEKYRVKNLPNCASCPGVYELGIVMSRLRSGREDSKLDPDFITPVYLGKAENVRNRLQQYGREGSHLENGGSCWKQNDCDDVAAQKGPGLFSEMFAKGFPIVYRWAPMTNSREAEKTEADLLDKFDYAWNKGSNGLRRRNDILKRIDRSSRKFQFLQKFHLLPQRRKGITIKACQRPLSEDGYNFYTNFPSDNFLAQVLKFGRSRPILVPWKSGIDEDTRSICGVALGHGVVCRKPPSDGRKRCAEHKGKKINATSSKLLAEGELTLAADKHLLEKDIIPVCGVILDDGSSCTMEPVQGNKRCLEHKGRRICYNVPESAQVKKEYFRGPILDYDKDQNIVQRKDRLNGSSGENVSNRCSNTICGVDLEDGTFCTRQPSAGRKRCENHKGVRLKEAGSRSFTKEIPCVFDASGAKSYSREEKKKHAFLPSHFSDKSSATCGMTLQNGGYCSRKPAEGNKRCWQHKGMRNPASSGSFGTCYKSDYHNTASAYSSFSSVYEEISSATCGMTLQNGGYCSRKPAEGNKRCWQHKGMRNPASSGSFGTCYKSDYHNTASAYSSFGSVYEEISPTCGAPLRNGGYCSRRSSGRCWQHRG